MISMARLPTDVKRSSWQEKLLRPGKSLPVRKQLDEPHNGEAVLEAEKARLTISLNQDWQFRRIESAAEPEIIPPGVTDGWEAANLPHSVRLEPANASAGRNFQGICWYS